MKKLTIPPRSILGRILYASITIFIPIFLFYIAQFNIYPEWQSGSIIDIALIFFSPKITIYFSSFLVYAMLSLGLLMIAPERFANRFIVVLGIYTGIIIAFQYVVIMFFASLFFIFWILIFGIIILASLSNPFGIISIFPLLALFGLLVIILFSPISCLFIFSHLANHLSKFYEKENPLKALPVLGVVTWFFTYFYAWRLALIKAIEIYTELPATQPDCYIATAAAKGHSQIVQATPVTTKENRIVYINTQLQYLKCAELVLLATFPVGHTICRKIYDIVGINLARLISYPILADIAYLSLKPAEWLCRALVKFVIPDLDEIVHRIYSNIK